MQQTKPDCVQDETAIIIAELEGVLERAPSWTEGGYIFVWPNDLAVKIAATGHPVAALPAYATAFPANARERFVNGRGEVAKLMERQAAIRDHVANLKALLAELKDQVARR